MSVTNKTDLVKKISDATGLTRKDSETVLNQVLDTIAVEVQQGNEVRLAGFGRFTLHRRGPRRVKLQGVETVSRGVNLVTFKAYDKLRSYDD